MESLGYLGIWQVVGILLQLPMPELQELVAVPKKFQDRLTEALKAVGWVKQRSNNKNKRQTSVCFFVRPLVGYNFV